MVDPVIPPNPHHPKPLSKLASSLRVNVTHFHNASLALTWQNWAPVVKRWVQNGCGIAAGLVGLLYITSFFESVMHSSTGFISGSSIHVAAITGFAVGTLHTVAGPDHLAGLAPLVVGQRRSPAAAFGLGALWGSGHATGQMLIGLACLLVHVGLLKTSWASAFSQFSGFMVGASLIAIGCFGLHEARDFDEVEEDGNTSQKSRFGWATYATGVLHGLSPDAIVFVAPALTLPRLAGVCHVTGVVVGTLVAMGACTTLLSAFCRRNPRVKSISSWASSIAILLGACILAACLGVSVPLPGL